MRQLIAQFTSAAVAATVTPPSPSALSDVSCRFRDMVSKKLYDQSLHFYKQLLHPLLFSSYGNEDEYQFENERSDRLLLLLPSIIKACSCTQSLCFGFQLHTLVVKTASDTDPVVSNSLISMYAKFSDPQSARQVFDNMPHRDAVSYNSLINCYAQNGRHYIQEALQMFVEMHARGRFTLKLELVASILSIIGHQNGKLFRLGRAIHGVVIVDGRIEDDSAFLSTALVDMYLRACDLGTAFWVFKRMEEKRNEVSWTAMVSGCTATGNHGEAIDCFRAMQVQQGIKPNRVSVIAVMPALVELGTLNHAKQIHGYSFRHGFNSELRFSSALIHTYSQFGEIALRPAKLIFETSMTKDVVMWSSLIGGFSQGVDSMEALKLYQKMRMVDGIEPNIVTLLALISACTHLNSLRYGRGVHTQVLKLGFHDSDIVVENSLINMYAKCGCLADSYRIFNEMDTRDVASWTALIGGYGIHGCGEDALHLFHEMQESGMEPDGVTLLSVLSACNHAGLVEEGQKLFYDAMKEKKKESLSIEHYACHLDMLGRAGKVEDACHLLGTMPMNPSMRMWSSLVSSCKFHGRLEVAEKMAHHLTELEPENAANYTALSMVYAESGNWVGVEEVRGLMRLRGLKKSFGFSQSS